MWVLIAPAALTEALGPLIALRQQAEHVLLLEPPCDLPALLEQRQSSDGPQPTTFLVVEAAGSDSRRGSPASPILTSPTGQTAAVGWLRGDAVSLSNYAERSVAVASRPHASRKAKTLVLLGPRERRYIAAADDLERIYRETCGEDCLRWTADRIRPEPMLRSVACGPAAVLYFGHGDRDFWLAYRGLSANSFAPSEAGFEPMAFLASLACETGSVGAHGDSLAEAMVAQGSAGAVLAPLGNVLHDFNRVLAEALVRTMASVEGMTVSQVLLDVTERGAPLSGYSLIGDPATRVCNHQAFLPAAAANR